MKRIKGILPYPGGKSSIVKFLSGYINTNIKQYRQPFIGGGSLYVHLIQQQSKKHIQKYSIYMFWKSLVQNNQQMRKRENRTGKQLLISNLDI